MPNLFKKLKNSSIARDLIATVAPSLATALGGPLAGVATKAIAEKMLGKGAATDTQVLDAILGASPADLVKLKELELTFAKDMKDAGIELDRIAADDRDSARKRQASLGDKMPNILAVLYTIAFFVHLFAISRGYVSTETLNNPAYLTILGALMTGQTMILTYFFGSSSGSASKNGIIAHMQKGPRG